MKIHHSQKFYTLRFDVETVSNLWRPLRRVSSSLPLTAALIVLPTENVYKKAPKIFKMVIMVHDMWLKCLLGELQIVFLNSQWNKRVCNVLCVCVGGVCVGVCVWGNVCVWGGWVWGVCVCGCVCVCVACGGCVWGWGCGLVCTK